ncbi:hypothetical protein NW756_006672 [Fusarium oxysporum]|nr:hypothetical protein NW753_008455 [Fusarium oxysporum]KAJ4050015.1 hypothetical protein NW763_009339 [Fusarium oxysporum]KAJ4090310.1 hypothetical protein NW756_006672 [Fusarium oxysporum]
MAQSKQDLEVKRLRKEAKKELRRETYKNRVAWLDKEWQGSHWLPKDVVRQYKPCSSVVRCLKSITELATTENIPLPSLWESGGFIRNVVDQDLATRKSELNLELKHPTFARLTKKMAKKAYRDLVVSVSNVGNDSSSSSGSTAGDNCEVEALEENNAVSRLSSPAFDSSTKQRLSYPLCKTTASTGDEKGVPPRSAKRALEDDDEETSSSPRNKSPRVTIDEVLGNLSSDRIETARRIMDVELDTALSVKRDAEKALMDLLRCDCPMAVTQAERVQARNRKQEADEAFRQTHERLHGPSQTLAAMSNLKKTFDAYAVRALKFENAEKVAQTCKDRLDKAQVSHEAALNSNPIDDWCLEAVWDMFKRADSYGKDIQ